MGLGKTLAELEHIDRDELTGWMAFYQLEPWGCLVEDHRTELGLNLLYGINSKQGTKIPRFIDRDPQGSKSAEPTPEELEQNIMDFFAGRTIQAPEKKPRKVRSDKGTKRGPRAKPSVRGGFGGKPKKRGSPTK